MGQIIRLTLTDSTAWDYSYGLSMIIGLFICLRVIRGRKIRAFVQRLNS